MNVSIVVPLYNEEESLDELYRAIERVMDEQQLTFEVLFIDDGSRDRSFDVLRALHEKHPGRVRVIRFSRNYGKAAALSTGFERARGEYIVTMDADLQDDPVAIPDMRAALDGGLDVVSGWKKKRLDPALTKNLPSKLFNLVVSLMSGVRLHDFNCGFKMYRAGAAKSLEVYGERHRFLPALAHWNGYRVGEVVVPHHKRKYGSTKYGFSRFFNGFFDLATLLFLKKYLKNPLHFFGLLGLALGLAGGVVLAWFGVQWLQTGHLHIRPLILLSMGAVIMGIQFFSIGLIGEMLINAVADKRSYSIKQEIDTPGSIMPGGTA